MQQKLTQADVFDLLKRSIELGGLYQVNADRMITSIDDGKVVMIKSGTKNLPMQVFSDKMRTGEHVFLNPLVEKVQMPPEVQWFYHSRMVIPGSIVYAIIHKIVDIVLAGKDETATGTSDYASLDLITEVSADIDEKTRAELNKLKPRDFGGLDYSKKTMAATLVVNVLDEDWIKEDAPEVRKKTWKVLATVCKFLYQTSDTEKDYAYKATILGMKEFDSVMHVFVKACSVLKEYAKIFIGVELDTDPLAMHLENLDAYQKISTWFSQATSKPEASAPTRPWESTIPGSTVPTPAAATTGRMLSVDPVSTVPTFAPAGLPVLAQLAFGPVAQQTSSSVPAWNGQVQVSPPKSVLMGNMPPPPMMAPTMMSPMCLGGQQAFGQQVFGNNMGFGVPQMGPGMVPQMGSRILV